jgi:Ca2+-transporting ATPase
MPSTPIFRLPPAQVYPTLETTTSGLSVGEVSTRQQLYGPNQLSEMPKQTNWRRLAGYLLQPLALILWIAGGITFGIHEYMLALVIWSLVLVNASFSFWREHRAEQAMLNLQRLLPHYTRLLREGVEVRLPASQVVPGDILILAEGDQIPADARLVESFGLRTNNAILTGEAVPILKAAEASEQEGISELEHRNLVFTGTSVVSCTGKAVVFATGMQTQFGRIAHLTQNTRDEPSPLHSELARLNRLLSLAALSIGGAVFIVARSQVGLSHHEALLLALGVIVATVPEGLTANFTITLAMAGQRLAQHGILVKKLSAIETLGNVSVICTDKSGTLTQNQMTVCQLLAGGRRFTVSGSGYEPHGKIASVSSGEAQAVDLHMLLTAATLCNNARITPPGPDQTHWSYLGDQTEAALRVAAIKGGVSEDQARRCFPRLHELPFDAHRKRMSTIHWVADQELLSQIHLTSERKDFTDLMDTQVAFVKGAPREILESCAQILVGNEIHPLDATSKTEVLAANDRFARQAMRVLALAFRSVSPHSRPYTAENIERDLIFLGLMAMLDPPRPEVAQAVATCKQAGIRMIMITGDYGLTAVSLANRIGMLETPDPLIVTGAEIDRMPEAELIALLQQEVIYARMAPEHKLRLVSSLQKRGEVVAVTGDGVNDTPALRKADVGVVMGLSGTDVAREAGDVILMQDNFAAIVTAIEEGRAVFENIRKFVSYIFSSNVPEILPFVFTSLFNIPLALSVKQILAIDLGTDMLPGLALGTERPEPDIMQKPPRKRNQALIDASVLRRAFLWMGPIEALLAFSGFFLVYSLAGRPLIPALNFGWLPVLFDKLTSHELEILAITIFHAGVVMAQAGNAFAARTETNHGRSLGWLSNRFLLFSIAAEIVLVLVLIYWPPLARLFNHKPLPAAAWLWLGLYPFAIYGLDWIRKFIARREWHTWQIAQLKPSTTPTNGARNARTARTHD